MTPEVGQFRLRATYREGVQCQVYLIAQLTPQGMWLKPYYFNRMSRLFDLTLHNDKTLRDCIPEALDPLEQLAFIRNACRKDNTCTWRRQDTWFASPTWKEAVEHLYARRCRYVMHEKRRLKAAEKACAYLEHYMSREFGQDTSPPRSTERLSLFLPYD